MREVRSDPEVLTNAVVDGINVFCRDVLIPRSPALKDIWCADEILRLQYQVAEAVAKSWTVCWIADDAEPEEPQVCIGGGHPRTS
jgi:hypothetical protein